MVVWAEGTITPNSDWPRTIYRTTHVAKWGVAEMYGLIGQIVVVEGRRPELATILTNLGAMPGCLSYVVANDTTQEDTLWVTEVWESAEAHEASLDLPEVRAAIEKGRPLVVGFESRTETQPVGGLGLGRPSG